MPETYTASTSYRLAILFAIFEAVRSKSRITSSFCLPILSSVRTRVHDAACGEPSISLDRRAIATVMPQEEPIAKMARCVGG
jgi:hypothetical protein